MNNTFQYVFTRTVFGVTWTITICHEGITFSRGSVPHWMPGAQLWEPYAMQFVASITPKDGLRKAAKAIRRMRRGLALSFC